MFVRELPPMRHHLTLTTPSGRAYRWAQDEPDAANVPSGLRHSDVMPGGFENLDVVLPRKSGVEYSDLERLTTVQVRDASGEVVGEYRLERTPRTSGSQMSVSPGCVGWQAALGDDKSAVMIPVDRDLSRWQGASVQRKINEASVGTINDASVSPDDTTGQPSLRTSFTAPWSAVPGLPIGEGWYDAGPGVDVFALFYAWKRNPNVDNTNVNWTWQAFISSDDIGTTFDTSGNLRAAGPALGSLIAVGTPRRYCGVTFAYTTTGGTDGLEYSIDWTALAVYGDHGLQTYGTPTVTTAPGVLASDVVAYAVSRWAPALNFSKGIQGTVRPSQFVIEHLVFPERTTAGEIVTQASRFDLPFWGVWANRTFWWDPSRTPRKRWRTRVSPAQLEETGPQVDRLWESVIVQFQDVDGTTKTVGPPGSGSDVVSDELKDRDPLNPANQAGIVRRDLLQMGTATVASAIEIGRRFLIEQKALDSSGRAQLVGYVEDDHGVRFPFSHVRSGDELSVVDAADASPRRIVHTEKDHATRTCTVDLDSPPEGLAALLERLGVGLVRLGL